MKRYRLFFLCLLALPTLGASGLFAADAFEGKVHFKITSTSNANGNEMDYWMKGSNIRVDMQSGKQTFSGFTDVDKAEFNILMPAQKMSMVVAMKTITDATSKSGDKPAGLEKTGKTDTILGHPVDEYISKDDRGNVNHLWLASDIGAFRGMDSLFTKGPFAKKNPNGWEQELINKGAFPLRVVTDDKNNAETMRMEATSVDKQSVPESMFQVPSDYWTLNLPALGGLGNMFGK